MINNGQFIDINVHATAIHKCTTACGYGSELAQPPWAGGGPVELSGCSFRVVSNSCSTDVFSCRSISTSELGTTLLFRSLLTMADTWLCVVELGVVQIG